MKVGLHSVTYSGLWYDGPGLAPLEFLRRARHLGFDGVELDGRRPHANPMELDASRRRAIREMCADLDLELVAIAGYNDFSSPIVEHRESHLLMVREHIRLARDLGAPMLRLFLAWPGVVVRDGIAAIEPAQRRFDALWRETTWLEAWSTCKRCLREVVRYAEDDGIVLALQNEPPVIRDHHDVLDMIAEVESPWLRASIDAAALARQDDDGVRQAVQDVADAVVLSHVEGSFTRHNEGTVELLPARDRSWINFPAFVRALEESGYDGYLCYKTAAPVLNARKEVQGIEFVDRQAALAQTYLRELVAQAQRADTTVADTESAPAGV
ncbi:MAG: sugar phosphate isomerase/epimerase [Chloroflexi bacterium]|nr:sugar phosphate isomerase/epimerase [Chloroflexota bacterium]